jgi:hypothetical protein
MLITTITCGKTLMRVDVSRYRRWGVATIERNM